MLMPKRVKRRRQFRGRMKGAAHKGTELLTDSTVSWRWSLVG